MCSVKGCTGTFHHTLLHPVKQIKSNPVDSKNQSTSTSTFNTTKESSNSALSNETSATCTLSKPCVTATKAVTSEGIYLCVVPVTVTYGRKSVNTYAFLDQGSTRSFCDLKLVELLGASESTDEVILQTLNGSKRYQGLVLSFSVASLGETQQFSLCNVLSIPNIPVSPNPVPVKEDLRQFAHLRGIEFLQLPDTNVTLLIGADSPEMFCVSEARKGFRGQPIAIKTPIGWSLLGPSLSLEASENCQVNFVKTEDSLRRDINCLWDNDFGCGTSILEVTSSKEDRIVYDLMQKYVSMVKGHYQLPLPWKSNVSFPGDSIGMAQRRLSSLKKRLQRNEDLHKKYTTVIENYVEKNYARIVPQDELDNSASDITWTLPHFPVYHPRKDKVRIVCDCAAKFKGVSLNDMLMQRPDLVCNLVGVLLRFRRNGIALIADIESTFYQVKVFPQDTQALRFLWWPNGNMFAEPVVYQMLVHLFGATSSPSVATFCLCQTATYFGCEFDPEIAEIVQRNFYVDDCLCSTTSPQKAISIVQQLTALLNKGGFRLTKWLTNCPEVLASIPVQERCASLQHQVINDNSKEMVLGVLWNVSDDTFGFHVTLPERPHTRRGVLSILSSLYDPLGFAAPITLGPKLLLQGLCKAGFAWDQSLTMEQTNEWEIWLKNLKDFNDLCIPRCLEPPDFGLIVKREIHNFADASAEAYGACSYLRTVNEFGDIHCCLLIGKCRLAPINSIPKLELTAAVLAVRLGTTIRRELSLDNCSSKFWSDSTAVLQTIKNSKKRFPVFVANRISVIETKMQTIGDTFLRN